MSLEDDYGKDVFEWYLPFKNDYFKIIDQLIELFDFDTMLDIGCGNNFILERVVERGKAGLGIDGSSVCLQFMTPAIRSETIILDVGKPFYVGDTFELVICLEVAEHLPPSQADTLVNNLFNHCGEWLYFSAATPGQGGHNHLNEQPHEYWIEKIRSRGFEYHLDLSKQLREFAGANTKLSWLRDNSMIFRMAE